MPQRARHARGHSWNRNPWRTSVQWQPPEGGPPSWAPLPKPTSLPELWAAMYDRLKYRGCEGALARTAEGLPTLPEMQKAEYWNIWGAFFAEVERGGLSFDDRFEAEANLKLALRQAELSAGGTLCLSDKQVLAMFDTLLAATLDPEALKQEQG